MAEPALEVRQALPSDLEAVVALRVRLWPEGGAAEHRAETADTLAGRPRSTMPLSVLVAERDGRIVGFAEVSLRSHADGCDPSLPCGFLEGWYVEPEHRRSGVGRALVEAAVRWCRDQGAVELASDTWASNQESQRAHEALGFEAVDRCVNYRMWIGPAVAPTGTAPPHYGADLASIHHQHFGAIAEGAARELLARLARAGRSGGTVVDLAAGSGILSRRVTEAGFAAWGVDVSPDMLRIAREETPRATFVAGSLWSAELPRAVAVAAVGEAFCYAVSAPPGPDSLAERLATIHERLEPGGLLLFDVAGPGRSGPGGARRSFWSGRGGFLGLEEREEGDRLVRVLNVFAPRGGLFRRHEETHVLRLYDPRAVEQLLERTGFAWERLPAYDGASAGAGWHAFAAFRR
jgi:aminoglycoside 6'-N-acetyltransferase I